VNRLKILCMLSICIGCMSPDSIFRDEHVDEDISLEEFKDLYDTRVELPGQAYSIYVYSHATIDSWDVRVVMRLPAGKAQAEIGAIQKRMRWMRDGANQVSSKINVVPVGETQSLQVIGWPDSNDAPSWWQAISMKDYKVVALGISNNTRYVWLYNAKDCRLAMWSYCSDMW
jgi:hypothetical protein